MHGDRILVERDLKHVWHPCSQMKDYELFKPLVIACANGSHLELTSGQKIIDAISSWWCKSLGHQHPRLKAALLKQLDQFGHVILANTTNQGMVTLSERLSSLTATLNKVFYASEGSSAVEIAMEMSLHARKIKDEKERREFVALQNGYHGETVGAMSVSDVGQFKLPYQSMLFDVRYIPSIPYVCGQEDEIWQDCETHWQQIEKWLAPLAATTTAIILEPIVQGAGGMKIYSQDFLRRLRQWTKAHDIHLIADEIMTGMGRTGKMLACEHANIEPDMICLSKGLTSGWLPLSAVLTSQAIYDLFYDDYESGKSFLHSHTYSGNALAVSVALAVLEIMREENLCEGANQIGGIMRNNMHVIANETRRLTNVRQIGAIVAADLVDVEENQRAGFAIYQKAVELGALLRPLGNTIYWLPPLTIELETLEELRKVTLEAVQYFNLKNSTQMV